VPKCSSKIRLSADTGSWFNQTAIVFGKIQGQVMHHRSFESPAALEQKLSRFIDYFNKTSAKPFDWTNTRRPSKAN
jgi:putative transposase